MRLITVALFVIQLGWAEVYAGDSPNGQERFLQLVAEAKGQKPGAVEALEEFFNVTSDKVLAVQSAALLALYSHSKLKKRPEVYAEYALLHESSPVVDRASLYRIAGDGHFAHGQFDKAQSLYSRALDDPSVPSDSKEYFSYKMAWRKQVFNATVPAWPRVEFSNPKSFLVSHSGCVEPFLSQPWRSH